MQEGRPAETKTTVPLQWDRGSAGPPRGQVSGARSLAFRSNDGGSPPHLTTLPPLLGASQAVAITTGPRQKGESMAESLTLTLGRDEVEHLINLVAADARPVLSWLLFDEVLISRLEDALCGSADLGHAMRRTRARIRRDARSLRVRFGRAETT